MIGLQSGDFANKPRPFADVRSEKKKLADGNGAESRACFFRFGSADHVLDQVVHPLG